LVNVDVYSQDVVTVRVGQPGDCCDACAKLDGCLLYTYINENPDGPICYLKKSWGKQAARLGVVTGVLEAPTAPPSTAPPTQPPPDCVEPWGNCGNANVDPKCCTKGQYCQPWNTGYYQCINAPEQCQEQYTNVDFYGDDIKTAYVNQPGDCCNECVKTTGCKAYTFVNDNPGGPACYLKKGFGTKQTKKGVVSGVVTSVTPPPTTAPPTSPPPHCDTPQYGTCGSDTTPVKCCPDKFYCMPWNAGFYQCMPTPEKCSKQITGMDFYGDDIKTVYVKQPDDCCNECAKTTGCKAYTFINRNPEIPACYLKKGLGDKREKVGAVSGVLN